MPDLLKTKKTLFSVKYPHVAKRQKVDLTTGKKSRKIFTNNSSIQNEDLGPGKRTRRLPKRWANEAVQIRLEYHCVLKTGKQWTSL